ncbi:MAG: HIT family protein [Micromonosporaceae bacterium]
MEPSEYVKALPIGERIPFPADGIAGWEIFPFEGDIRVKVLEAPVLPEPPRYGEAGRECVSCATADDACVWTDEHWRLKSLEPRALPSVLILEPRAHHDMADLPPDLAARLGPMIQRVERAISSLDGVGRVHLNKWGDGGAHLHLWFFARPAGMMQLRGTCLPLWDDVLPVRSDEAWREMCRTVAAAMAAGGGVAHV